MFQIKDLNINHKKDLRTIISSFNIVLNYGDKAVIIGEEGDGKSTLIKWIYSADLIEDYADYTGEKVFGKERISYLPQEMMEIDKSKTIYDFLSESERFFELSPREIAEFSQRLMLAKDFFYSDQVISSLSGGERIKLQMFRILINEPTVLLLDEPSNDIDISTLEWLEQLINGWPYIVLFVSHDETLIEHTANYIIHFEQLKRKKEFKYTVSRKKYIDYISERERLFDRQEQIALGERREKKIRDEKLQRMMQSVDYAQAGISRSNPSGGRLLKKKMHSIKSLQKRYEREDASMTEMPDQEDAIFLKLGDKGCAIPNGKIVLDFYLDKLSAADQSKVLSQNIKLIVKGPEKVCIVGDNGCGKTTLIRMLFEQMRIRDDISIEYMPQNYEDILDLSLSPVDFLDETGDKNERTKIRTYLGALKYTTEEMSHPIKELSGGQKAKILLLKISLSNANVLLLDEPTRNFSPLSGPVIRKLLSNFQGAIISISHDRKYINEVCDKVYQLGNQGLTLLEDEG